jgi:hypothetical protein
MFADRMNRIKTKGIAEDGDFRYCLSLGLAWLVLNSQIHRLERTEPTLCKNCFINAWR